MKKIISIIVICLFAKVSIAQNNTYEGNANTMTNFASSGAPTAYGLTKSYVVNAGIFSDTSQANIVNYLKNYNGAQIMTYSGGVKWWLRYGNTWNQISGSATSGWALTGNSGTVAGTNFLGTTDSVRLDLRTNNTIRQSITGSGNVGIGTTAPTRKIDVVGAMKLQDTWFNTFVTGGNTTASGGDNNVAVGASLQSLTTGSTNIAIGYNALSANTSGSNNIANGRSSLNSNTEGVHNIGIGYQSLLFNTTSSNNVGIGRQSFYLNTGSSNIGLGAYSGINNTTQSNRLYINSISRATILDDTTKSIIYGYQDATASNQRLYLNSKVYVPYLSTGIPSGAKRALIGPDGQVYAADTTAGGGGTYSAGYGLSLSSTTFSADSSVLTNRVTALGTLYDSTSWSNLGGFTIVGSPTTSVSSNKINVSAGNQSISATVGTSNSAFNQVLKVTSYGGTMLEKNKVTLKFKVNVAPAGTTYGVAVGTYSINTGSSISNSVAYFNMSTGTGTGTVSLLAGTGNVTVAVSPTALTFSQNDYIILTYERIGDKILATARNQTTNSSPVTCIYGYDATTAFAAALLPNTSNFSIVNLGGAYIIDSLNITSNEAKYANVMFVGDSKFSGYTAGYDVGIPQLFNRYYGGSISCSGQSDRTQDVLNHIAEIIRINPKTVVLCIGRNDIAGGVSSGTWQANIASIVSQLEAAGITVRLLDAIYETSVSQATLLSYIPATYPTKYIGTYAPGNFTGSVSSDKVHPSYTGSKAVANVIYQSLLVTDNGKYLNKKDEGLRSNTSFDSARVYGTLRVGTNVGTAFDPDSWTAGDIIVGLNGALTSWYGANTQKNRLVISNNSNSGMDFRTYYGSTYPAAGGFTWYTGNTSTGSQTAMMQLSTNGVLKTGSAVNQNWSGGATGDIFMYYQNKIIGASSSSINDQANLCLFDNTASTVFRNYRDVGAFKFFTSGGSSGSQSQAMTILPSGNVGIGSSVTAPTSALHTTSFATAYVAKTANYTATSSDHTIEATSGTFTITLPTAVGITGRTYVLTNSGSGVVTIGTTSSQTFVNVSATPITLSVGQFNTVTVQSNGANWLRLTNL